MALKKVTLEIVCRDYEAEGIASEMLNSHIAQQGVYTLGTNIQDLIKEEKDEVYSQLPPDIIEDLEEE